MDIVNALAHTAQAAWYLRAPILALTAIGMLSGGVYYLHAEALGDEAGDQ